MTDPDRIRILFVCLGNICRSPTAESVFRQRVEAAGLREAFEIDSAGILDVHQGQPADARMRRHASQRGYELDSISRPVVPEDFARFDHIVAMDHQNLADLLSLLPDPAFHSKLSLLLDEAPELNRREVPDPYYGGAAGFEEVLDLVETACDRLLERLEP